MNTELTLFEIYNTFNLLILINHSFIAHTNHDNIKLAVIKLMKSTIKPHECELYLLYMFMYIGN